MGRFVGSARSSKPTRRQAPPHYGASSRIARQVGGDSRAGPRLQLRERQRPSSAWVGRWRCRGCRKSDRRPAHLHGRGRCFVLSDAEDLVLTGAGRPGMETRRIRSGLASTILACAATSQGRGAFMRIERWEDLATGEEGIGARSPGTTSPPSMAAPRTRESTIRPRPGRCLPLANPGSRFDDRGHVVRLTSTSPRMKKNVDPGLSFERQPSSPPNRFSNQLS